MSENSKIEWTDHTFNPWEGCQKVGPGCDHCYAETRNVRFGGGVAVNWGPGAPRRRTSEANWRKPLQWNRASFFQCPDCGLRGDAQSMGDVPKDCQHARAIPARQRVFCASLADVFDNEVNPQWRDDLWSLIRATPAIDWLLLTKRIGNAARMLPCSPDSFGAAFPNVWLGATVVNQDEVDRDVPKLLKIYAAQWFLSIEPMLGPITLRRFLGQGFGPAPTWVIAGGESGPQARPSSPDWFRSLRDECGAVGVPFLFKQWGEWLPMLGQRESVSVGKKSTTSDGWVMGWAGKKTAGRLLDGTEHNGFPRSYA